MILVGALAAAVLLGLLQGGSLFRLGELRFRLGPLALGALAIQVLVIARSRATRLDAALLLISFATLLVFALANLRLSGLPLLAAGLLLNLAAMAANGGFMPVTPQALEYAADLGSRVPGSKDIVLERHQIRLYYLTDILVLRRLPLPTAFSVGDVLIAAGLLILVPRAMRQRSSAPQ
ncbi:MAG: DUF5317 family protein [Deinococcus sp.]|nr:DUF5317 family protein [Deinococcus sp.]